MSSGSGIIRDPRVSANLLQFSNLSSLSHVLLSQYKKKLSIAQRNQKVDCVPASGAKYTLDCNIIAEPQAIEQNQAIEQTAIDPIPRASKRRKTGHHS